MVFREVEAFPGRAITRLDKRKRAAEPSTPSN